MKKILKSITLGAIGFAAMAFFCWRHGVQGLAWFPGFVIALVCFIGILEVNQVAKGTQNNQTK